MATGGNGMVWMHGWVFRITRAASIMGQGEIVWLSKVTLVKKSWQIACVYSSPFPHDFPCLTYQTS